MIDRRKQAIDWRKVTWGRPDSPPTFLCSACSATLPEVPLVLWNAKGRCVRLCDACAELALRDYLRISSRKKNQ
jgi:hypothetical protein